MHLYTKQKKIKKLIISSNNRNKINEINYILPVNFKLFNDIGWYFNFQEIDKRFEETALIKAEKIFKIINISCISDHVELEVIYLSINTGIYSSITVTLIFNINNNYISDAILISFICLKWHNYHYFFKGILLGDIAQKTYKSKLEFLDYAIFISNNYGKITLFQLSIEEKNNISHRAKGIKKCLNFLENYK